MDEIEEAKIEKIMKLMMQDPITLKEMEHMRDRGRSEQFIQNWLRQLAQLSIKPGK
ncbi:MAG: hypothetical protein LKF47_02280 [Megasphaera sp.]|nr:hypothetical protein [Megasphaera sp.]MCI1247429.1 hypothetical protein [Megasphaera sp.]